jgi:succinate dehydrogenase/fumarate reductase flavoprotein subunit
MGDIQTSDFLVIGKGNAALCAALAACEQGASVTMLEAASEVGDYYGPIPQSRSPDLRK